MGGKGLQALWGLQRGRSGHQTVRLKKRQGREAQVQGPATTKSQSPSFISKATGILKVNKDKARSAFHHGGWSFGPFEIWRAPGEPVFTPREGNCLQVPDRTFPALLFPPKDTCKSG